MFDQIHDGMREADVIALLGTPWPANYDADGGGPIPVALLPAREQLPRCEAADLG